MHGRREVCPVQGKILFCEFSEFGRGADREFLAELLTYKSAANKQARPTLPFVACRDGIATCLLYVAPFINVCGLPSDRVSSYGIR